MSVSDLIPRAKAAYQKLQQTTLGQFPGEFAKNVGNTAVGMAQGALKAPLNLANTAYDLTQQVQGKDPSQGYNAPGLGKVQGYGREYLNNAPTQGGLAAGIGAVSHGILDAAGTATLASKAIPSLNKSLSAPAVSPRPANYLTENLKTSGEGDWANAIKAGDIPKEAIYQPDGTFTPAATDHIISDLTLKMEAFKKGLGEAFKKSVDTGAPTQDSLISQAIKFAQNHLDASKTSALLTGAGAVAGLKDVLSPTKANAEDYKTLYRPNWIMHKGPGSSSDTTLKTYEDGAQDEYIPDYIDKNLPYGKAWSDYVRTWLNDKPAGMSTTDFIKSKDEAQGAFYGTLDEYLNNEWEPALMTPAVKSKKTKIWNMFKNSPENQLSVDMMKKNGGQDSGARSIPSTGLRGI